MEILLPELENEYVILNVKISKNLTWYNEINVFEHYIKSVIDEYENKVNNIYSASFDIDINMDIVVLLDLLNSIRENNKNFRYQLTVKKKEKKYKGTIRINKKGKAVFTKQAKRYSLL